MSGIVAFVGRSQLAERCIDELLGAGVDLRTLVVNGFYHAPDTSSTQLPHLKVQMPGKGAAAWYARARSTTAGYRVRVIGVDDASAIARLRDSRPSHLISVCFPTRIAADLISIATHLACNLHPSHLPRYRGPAPVFWQLRDGQRQLGVSVHALTAQIDAGALLWQGDVALTRPLTATQIAQQCAVAGARALSRLISERSPPATRQDELQATWQPLPVLSDFDLDPRWSCDRARRFIQGTLHWPFTYSHSDHQQRLPIRGLSTHTQINVSDSPVVTDNRTKRHSDLAYHQGALRHTTQCDLRFIDGVVGVQLAAC